MRAGRGQGAASSAHLNRRLLALLGGAAILALVGERLGSGPFLAALEAVTPGTLVAAVGIGLLTTGLSAWRWTLVAGALGLRLPLRGAVADYYQALFLNGVLPAGVLGDVDRAVRHGRAVGDLATATKVVVLERTAGQLVLVAAGVAALVANPWVLPWSVRTIPSSGRPTSGSLVAGLIAGSIAGLIAIVVIRRVVRRRRPGRPSVWRGWAADARRGLFGAGHGAGIFAASGLALLGYLATFVLAARASGATAPLRQLVPVMLVALLAMSLPLSIGGWGAREGATVWGFAATGLDAAQGLTIALVYGLCVFVASLPGAVVLVGRSTARARADRDPTAQVLIPVR